MMFTEAEQIKIKFVKEIIKLETESFLHQLADYFPDSVMHKIVQNIFISGGCITSLIHGEKVNDYDLYFKDEDTMFNIKNLFTNQLKEQIEDVSENYREVLGVDGKLITENAITLKSRIQLITKHFGEPDNIRKTFDFVHCMPYYDFAVDKLYISRIQYDAIINRKMISQKENFNHFIGTSRVEKFKKRGFTW